MMQKKLIIIMALVVLLPDVALAQLGLLDTGRDADKPVDITADDLTVKAKENLAIFKGNVQAEQGNFHLKADQMDVYYHDEAAKKKDSPNALSKVIAKGKVVLTVPDKEAHADQGVYDVDSSQVELTGNVVLIRDKNRLQGERFIYDVANGTSKLLSDKNNSLSSAPPGDAPKKTDSGRVRGFFVPKQKQSTPQ